MISQKLVQQDLSRKGNVRFEKIARYDRDDLGIRKDWINWIETAHRKWIPSIHGKYVLEELREYDENRYRKFKAYGDQMEKLWQQMVDIFRNP